MSSKGKEKIDKQAVQSLVVLRLICQLDLCLVMVRLPPTSTNWRLQVKRNHIQKSLIFWKLTWRKNGLKCHVIFPFYKKRSLRTKLCQFIDKMKDHDWNQLKKKNKDLMIVERDYLFDIAACKCDLPLVECTSRY